MLVRVLATAAWLAVLAPSAQAVTTVEVTTTRLITDRGLDYSTSRLHVRSGDEANDLRLEAGADGAIVVSDTAGVSAGAGCTGQADGSARCVFPYPPGSTEADVGGGDDPVLVTGGRATVSGGPGNDTLEGFASYDYANGLDGGPGDDIIRGNGTLTGGAGRDQLVGSGTFIGDGGPALEPDVIVGGPGVDWVVFTGTSTPVAVDLADPGPDGGDTVIDVERATGGAGDDRLAGTEGDNLLEGGGGSDVLLGRGGNDVLRGGAGDDRVDGGAGGDRLEGGPGRDGLIGGEGPDNLFPGGARGTNDCGAGADALVDPGSRMVVGPDCERLVVDLFDLTHVRFGRALRFSLQWDDTSILPPCRTNLTVLRGTRTVATKSIRTPDARVQRVKVPLPAGARSVPLRLAFRWAQSCRPRSGGHPVGGFVVSPTGP